MRGRGGTVDERERIRRGPHRDDADFDYEGRRRDIADDNRNNELHTVGQSEPDLIRREVEDDDADDLNSGEP